MTEATNTERSIVLVPGYWLGGWAWDAVIDQLRRGGHPAFAITLPGLDDRSTPRASIHFSDHVDAVADAVRDVSGPTANGAVPRPDVAADSVELALPSFEELKSTGVSLAGLDDDALQRFRDRSVPHSAGAVREPLALKNPDRNAVPATIVRCSFPSHAVRDLAGSGNPMFVALTELQDLTYVDPPTGHWPMWSRPDDLAEIIAAESERD
jgi:hypothetical protein